MKVLIATGLFPPQVGGPATYSKLLLDKLPERGFDVRVVSFGQVLKYPVGIRHFLYFFKILSSSLRADIVYALDPVSVGLPALAAAKLARKKFFVKIVGDYAWEQGVQRFGVTDLLDKFSTESKKYPWKVRVLKWTQRLVANSADKILVPSEYLKRIISNWGVEPLKVTVIYNAFNLADSRSVQNRILHKNDVVKTVISAGRLVPWKGFDTLISIWPEVQEEVPDATLFIAGDGPEKDFLEKLRKESPARNSIKLLGRLEQKELFERIKGSDIFILNTAYEGLSHQLLEVMALEVPIVTTNVGGNPEVIKDGESGMLVPYNDSNALKKAIVTILQDKEFAFSLAMNGRNRLTRFDEKKMFDNLEAFLRA